VRFQRPLTGKPFVDLGKIIKWLTASVGIVMVNAKEFRHNFLCWTDQENALATQEAIGPQG